MAGVFEVEVDGVEHDHGLQHHDDNSQVKAAGPQRGVIMNKTDGG